MIYENTPVWWIFFIALGLLSLLIYWDIQSRAKKWRVWRLLANVLIIISFLGLYLKPYIVADADSIKVALLTKSHAMIDTDSLEKNRFRIIENFDEYLRINTTLEIEELVVLGDGLESWELSQVSHAFKYFEPMEMMEGPVEASSMKAVVNSRSPLAFRIVANDSMNIYLSGTGIDTSMESVDMESGEVTFEVKPKVAGNLTYQLTGVRGTDTLFSELVPIKVQERTKFNTLILTSAPSFEIRFLKNLLKEEGYGVAERLQVSKETYRESFSNLNNRSLRQLSRTLLQDFKILVMDKDSYDELSYSEKQNVNTALKKDALGIIWMDSKSNMWLKTREIAAQSVALKANQQTVELVKSVSSSGYDQQVEIQGNVIGHVHYLGLGKVMLPLLDATYQLQLKGHDQLYSELWNELLQPIVGIELKDWSIQTPTFPRIDEPTTFTFYSKGEIPVYLDSTRIAVKEKWHQPGVYTAIGWPATRGWNQLKVGDRTHLFFAYSPEDWEVQKAQQKRKQTAAFVSSNDNAKTLTVETQKPVSKWLFFSVLILSFAFLWIEGRLN